MHTDFAFERIAFTPTHDVILLPAGYIHDGLSQPYPRLLIVEDGHDPDPGQDLGICFSQEANTRMIHATANCFIAAHGPSVDAENISELVIEALDQLF